jgi:hypothetical protein
MSGLLLANEKEIIEDTGLPALAAVPTYEGYDKV